MKRILLLLSMIVALSNIQAAEENSYVVKANDAKDFLHAIDVANKKNGKKEAERFTIFVPDGTYDLGKKVLTTLRGHNISIIGQSMMGTIIVNRPDVEREGISKTGTLVNRGWNNYLQDLTLRNALDYYNSGKAGRAVCLQDKGRFTICKNVRMLSYQDTYYSDNDDAQHYWENCEIHGTVDFICGSGDVYFNKCRLVVEKRNLGNESKGECVITAAHTNGTKWGYIFDNCIITSNGQTYTLGRAWADHPQVIFKNTIIVQPFLLGDKRYREEGMNTENAEFLEYNTHDFSGKDITPKSNVLTVTCRKTNKEKTFESIVNKKTAKKYSLKNVMGEWQPEKIAKILYQDF